MNQSNGKGCAKGAGRRNDKIGYLFIGPAALLIVLFSLCAMVISFYVSLHKWDVLVAERPFVGLRNYSKALSDPLFWTALKNTSYYTLLIVPSVVIGSLLLALMASSVRVGQSFFKTVYFIPSITPVVVISLIWIWLYQPNGMVNIILGGLHIPKVNWLVDPNWAMPAIVIMSAWQATGYYMLIFMAGLNDIPSEFYDAARVDGATKLQELWHVTIPLLRNTFVFVVAMLIIGAYQVFTQVYIMTNGGPERATEVMAAVVFKKAFQHLGKMGVASAISWLLFLIIFVFVLAQMKIMRSRRSYD